MNNVRGGKGDVDDDDGADNDGDGGDNDGEDNDDYLHWEQRRLVSTTLRQWLQTLLGFVLSMLSLLSAAAVG